MVHPLVPILLAYLPRTPELVINFRGPLWVGRARFPNHFLARQSHTIDLKQMQIKRNRGTISARLIDIKDAMRRGVCMLCLPSLLVQGIPYCAIGLTPWARSDALRRKSLPEGTPYRQSSGTCFDTSRKQRVVGQKTLTNTRRNAKEDCDKCSWATQG